MFHGQFWTCVLFTDDFKFGDRIWEIMVKRTVPDKIVLDEIMKESMKEMGKGEEQAQ